MPAIPVLIAGIGGVVVGWTGGSLFQGDLGKIIKWGVIGGGVYVGAKTLKVI